MLRPQSFYRVPMAQHLRVLFFYKYNVPMGHAPEDGD